jgi:Holliday junction resolvase RusA-like endonuclease
VSAIKLDLPLPPSINRAWRKGKQGQLYLDKSVKSFRTEVAWNVRGVTRKTITEPVRIKVTFHGKSNRSYDVDNRAKSLLDALEHARFLDNDRQVTDLHACAANHARRSVVRRGGDRHQVNTQQRTRREGNHRGAIRVVPQPGTQSGNGGRVLEPAGKSVQSAGSKSGTGALAPALLGVR